MALCAAVALFTSPLLSVLLSFIFLFGGYYCFSISYQHRSNTSKYREHLVRVETLLGGRTEALSETSTRYRQLVRNLAKVRDGMIEETELYCNAIREEANQFNATAKLHSATVNRVAQRYLDEQRKWWTQKLRGDNFQLQKGRIEKAVTFVDKEAFRVPSEMKKQIFEQLRRDYESRVRKEKEMERQRELKSQIRAEQ